MTHKSEADRWSERYRTRKRTHKARRRELEWAIFHRTKQLMVECGIRKPVKQPDKAVTEEAQLDLELA